MEQVRNFFEKCRVSLAMVYRTMFPLNPQPETLLVLLSKFKNPAEVWLLVRNQLITGAETAFGFVQARYPTLDLLPIANANVPNMAQFQHLVEGPAEAVIKSLERSTEAALLARAERDVDG